MIADDKLRFAIQSKGRLKDESLSFLFGLDVEIGEIPDRALVAISKDKTKEIIFVRHGDVPEYVQAGVADFGIVGKNVLHETDYNVKILQDMPFGECRLIIAVPENSPIKKVEDLESERIATSYPQSLKKFLQKMGLNASISIIKGSVEVAPILGLSDAICDLTQTGKTLKENKLRILETIFTSNAVLIQSPIENDKQKQFLRNMQERQK